MPHTMTADEVRAFLSHGTRTAKVATSGPGGRPHVMPVWFVLDGEELVFTTDGDSVKGRNLRRDPCAAVVVDEEVAPYAFVQIRGRVTLSEDLERAAALRHGDRWPVHGPRPSRGVRPPQRGAG
jgi:PPOX class probable F420-dependent enzyme